jgi:ribosome-binding protein aMBF1 (putative translation factor)
MPKATPSTQLPYKGETCDVCGSLAVRIVHYEGDTLAICRTCNPANLYN